MIHLFPEYEIQPLVQAGCYTTRATTKDVFFNQFEFVNKFSFETHKSMRDTRIPNVSADLGDAILLLSTSLDKLIWMTRAGLLDCWLLSHIRLLAIVPYQTSAPCQGRLCGGHILVTCSLVNCTMVVQCCQL